MGLHARVTPRAPHTPPLVFCDMGDVAGGWEEVGSGAVLPCQRTRTYCVYIVLHLGSPHAAQPTPTPHMAPHSTPRVTSPCRLAWFLACLPTHTTLPSPQVTSLFLHLVPALVSLTLRWHQPEGGRFGPPPEATPEQR